MTPDPYDALTIAALAAEFNSTIWNGRIQRIGLVDRLTIGAEIYAGQQRWHLLASADDRQPRLRLAAALPSLDPALITPFGLLLRKYVRGGVILSIDQPPLERLLRMSIAKRLPAQSTRGRSDPEAEEDHESDHDEAAFDEGFEIAHLTLYVELMGRHSNIILVGEDGAVMDSAKRVTSAMSRVRPVRPHRRYASPPAMDRRDPRESTTGEISALLTGQPPGASLARTLVNAYRGLSPQLAREVIVRAGSDAQATVSTFPLEAAGELGHQLRDMFTPLRTGYWEPCVYRGHPNETAVACAPFPLASMAVDFAEQRESSMSTALSALEEATGHADLGRHAQRRRRLQDQVAAARERAARRLASLEEEERRSLDAERLKTWGELIYAHLWEIAPGQMTLTVADSAIPLDPALTPSEQAQAYFEQYRKAQSAAGQLPALAEASRTELAYLDQLATMIAQAPGFAELEALTAEWQQAEQPGTRAQGRKSTARRPRALLDSQGNSVLVGRSGPQNDHLTFDIAGPDDTWLHARGVGGSHVIIRWRAPGAEDSEETILAAAALAAWYSASRESSAVEVDVAKRKHVRKIPGARPGMVTYRNERTMRVKPRSEADLGDVLREG